MHGQTNINSAAYILYLEDGDSRFLQTTHTTRCHVPEDREHGTTVRMSDLTIWLIHYAVLKC